MTTDFVFRTAVVEGGNVGNTTLLLEARGDQMLPDGSPDADGHFAPPTPWHTVGHFTDSGQPTRPTWMLAQPSLAHVGGALPEGNTGVFGIGNLDSCEFIQVRLTFFLAEDTLPTDAGHWLDDWTIRFKSDQ